jgi:hypothetical protein
MVLPPNNVLSLIRHGTGQYSTEQREKWNDYEMKGVEIAEDIEGY